MSTYFFDDFTDYAVGSTMPQGQWFGTGTVQGNGVNPAPNRSFQTDTNFGGAGAWGFFFPVSSLVFYCSFAVSYGLAKFSGPILSFGNTNSGPPPYPPPPPNPMTVFLTVWVEDDFSISLQGPGGNMGYPPGYLVDPVTDQVSNTQVPESGITPFSLNVQPFPDGIPGGLSWHYMYGTMTLMGSTNITVGATISIDGQGYTGGNILTGIGEDSTYLGKPEVNQIILRGEFGEASFGNVAVTSTGSGFPTPTVPPNYVNARVSQIVAELLWKPPADQCNARMSQLAAELLSMPDTTLRNARASQLAVELCYGFNPSPSSGGVVLPQYYKRRNLLANN
jgi:hypothetical protein